MKSELTELQIEYTHQQDHITILDGVVLELRSEIELFEKICSGFGGKTQYITTRGHAL